MVLSKEEIDFANMLSDLHVKWKPHAGQVPIGHALFYKQVKNIFIKAGRNWGKTEFCAYASSRWGQSFPWSESYYFGPLQNQIREILWASNRIQNFIPDQWKAATNKTEMRISLKNGSFLKLDGADNEDARRGIKPKGIVIYDELKDMKLSFINAMDDNRAAFDSPAIYIGTPPEFRNHFMDLEELAKQDPSWAFFHAPSSQNPYISKAFLERKKAQYIAMGDIEGWLREFEAITVIGGKKHIFPQFLTYKCKPRASLLPLDINKWHLVIGFDPGSATTFAVLFALYNPYSKKLHFVDEIYEQTMAEMTARKIYLKTKIIYEKYKAMGIQPRSVRFIYDEAALWFRNEMSDPDLGCDWWLEPTMKATNSEEYGIGLIRDMFTHSMVEIAEECVKFRWELENYIKDEKGRIPDKNNHTIDLFRYILAALGYEFKKELQPKEVEQADLKRAFALKDEVQTQWTEIGE